MMSQNYQNDSKNRWGCMLPPGGLGWSRSGRGLALEQVSDSWQRTLALPASKVPTGHARRGRSHRCMVHGSLIHGVSVVKR